MLFLLPCLADSMDIVVVVVMGWHCKHALMGVVLVVAEVLLMRLPVPAVVLPDIGLGVTVGIVLAELGGSFPAWQVVLDTCKSLFRFLMAGFHNVVDEVLIIEGLLEVPIYVREVGV